MPAEQLPHRGARARARQQLALLMGDHVDSPQLFSR
jgi:hypothetical protein